MTQLPKANFWQGRRVFLTGHTGFKGAWLALWLQKVGAEVTAFSLAAPTQPNLFEVARVHEGSTRCMATSVTTRHWPRRCPKAVPALSSTSQPRPRLLTATAMHAGTFATNLTGTLNLLDAIHACPSIEAAVLVTSDKCYAPGSDQPLREDAPMGGRDPYSASKSCAEIAVQCWRDSFFAAPASTRLATARAGNVIGGGDWSAHRLLPDLARAFSSGTALNLRIPPDARQTLATRTRCTARLSAAGGTTGRNRRQ